MESASDSDSEQEHESRRKCKSCGEKLAHSVYFRHLHDLVGSVCPGKVQPLDRSDSEADSDMSEVMQNSSSDLDSTFDLGSESDGHGFSE